MGAVVELRLTEGRLYEPANLLRAFNTFSGFRLFDLDGVYDSQPWRRALMNMALKTSFLVSYQC